MASLQLDHDPDHLTPGQALEMFHCLFADFGMMSDRQSVVYKQLEAHAREINAGVTESFGRRRQSYNEVRSVASRFTGPGLFVSSATMAALQVLL